MTPEQTTVKTDNELIAEFHGWKKHNPTSFGLPPTWSKGKKSVFDSKYFNEYATSWDWLMPVVRKVQDALDELSDKHNIVPIDESDNGGYTTLDHMAITEPMPTVYEAVVSLIKFINDNQQQS